MNELNQLSESNISDFEKCTRKIYPLMVPWMKASFMWPFWTRITKYGAWMSFAFYVLFIISTFFYIARITGNDELDMNLITELCIQLCIQCFITSGMYFLILDKRGRLMIRELLFNMIRNLLECSSEEKKFLQNYISIANFASYLITGLVCVTYNIYLIITPILWPVAANFISSGNHTYQKRFSIHLELFVDENTHFYYFFAIVVILCCITQVLASSIASSYILVISYVVGKFRFLGFKLKQISNLSQTEDFLKKDYIFKHVLQLVQLHQDCIYYFDLLNKITSSTLVPTILSVIVCFSITGCLIVIEFKEDINVALKMGVMYALSIETLLLASYPSQMIYDASSDIFNNCYSTDWYKYPMRTRKMIRLMMMRSSRPSCVKIGPSKFLNFETIRQIIQLSLSYVVSLMSIYYH